MQCSFLQMFKVKETKRLDARFCGSWKNGTKYSAKKMYVHLYKNEMNAPLKSFLCKSHKYCICFKIMG